MHAIPRRLAILFCATLALGACATDGAPRAPDAPGFDGGGRFHALPATGPTRDRAAESHMALGDTYARAKVRAADRRDDAWPVARFYLERDEERTRALSGGRVVSVPFAAGSARFVPFALTRLRLLYLLPHAARIEIRGRTDGRGSRAANERIALARAEAAKRYLLRRGVPAHMIAIGYRATGDYVGDVATAAGRRASRRADIEFVPSVDADRGAWLAMTGGPCSRRLSSCIEGAS